MTFPRRELAVLPTPLHRVGGLHLKRDDLTGFGVAGNKARPLEFLLGDALARGADLLVTAGAPGSNFVAATALAASMCGLDCDVLVARGASATSALALAERAGARLLHTAADRDELDELVDKHVARLRGDGRTPYGFPRGGANAVGALGFAHAAAELSAQLGAAGLDDAVIVLPTGSGASLAGLLAGRAALYDAAWRVVGVSVSRPLPRMLADVLRLAAQCAALTGTPAPTEVDLIDAVGAGFGTVTDEDHDAALVALRGSGVLLDPTYGTKAFAVAMGLVGGPAPVVLWHTGGLPSALRLLTGSPVSPRSELASPAGRTEVEQ